MDYTITFQEKVQASKGRFYFYAASMLDMLRCLTTWVTITQAAHEQGGSNDDERTASTAGGL